MMLAAAIDAKRTALHAVLTLTFLTALLAFFLPEKRDACNLSTRDE
jgi:hypothetical protein